MKEIHSKDSVGSVVAADFKTSAVFNRHGIDFCCGGMQTLEEAAATAGIDPATLISELAVALKSPDESAAYDEWPLGRLIAHIESRHHHYVETHIPVIQEMLDKLCRVHGHRHPELPEVREHFGQGAAQLLEHMKKEEKVLFPMIRNMLLAAEEGRGAESLPYSVSMPIRMMRHEHETEGARFAGIANITGNYTVPDDGCTTYRAAYALLKEFESDLHRHIHLENNILFPKAMEMECGSAV
ncbi:MAG: iron-sulfur cluster repair di-iron protein [Bacteroidia bacterium]|nr:iron-sulfur cluster repair di-iron protein [Bacteroidia bacterium]